MKEKTVNKEHHKMIIEGELTIFTAADTKTRLMASLEQYSVLEIDLSQVTEMDSAGLQLLILAKNEGVTHDCSLSLTGHTTAVLDVLDLCNMLQFFGDPVVMSS